MQLDRKILKTLEVEGPLPTVALARRVGAPVEEVAARCLSLTSERRMRPAGQPRLNELDCSILVALAGNGSLSTRELADEVGASRDAVYRRCVRLAAAGGPLASETRSGHRRLYFFPATGAVLNRSNYEEVDQVVRQLRQIVDRHRIQRGAQLTPSVKNALRADYHRYLAGLAAEAPPRVRRQLRSFEGELMSALNHTTKSSVAGLFGLRPFSPKVRVWFVKLLVGGAVANGGALPGDVIWELEPDENGPSAR